ncbi:Ldh family oxidoreductase [Schlesneria sp. T3-172]|uniref:Ldh family oxidoreductase n=1 Tax=Schlesneria sphaerica TaxID=3373610 RepID=UPI0037CB2C91
MSPTTNSPSISIDALTQFCLAALTRVGVSQTDAKTTASALVTTDAMGVFTHGTKLLAGYLNKLKGGGYRAGATPRIEREGLGWALIDGESALGQVGSDFAMRTAIEKARKVGVAYVGLRNTGHIGAAGYYAASAARQGFIAMVTGNDIPSVAAPGSKRAVLGSNPIAYGVPHGNGEPIVLDMATAAVAGGKIYAAIQRGETIPSTWLIDQEGQPTVDGSLYPDRASLAPMAGHKGYGFGLWCEILSAVLPGGKMTWQVGSWIFDDPSLPSEHNASFIAIDIGAMVPREQFDQRLQHLIDEIHAAPTAAGIERVLLPGEREWGLYRKAQQEGIKLPQDVRDKLVQAAAHAGIEPPAELSR